MATGDLPTIFDAGHAHSTYSAGNLGVPISSLDSWTAGATALPFNQNFDAGANLVGVRNAIAQIVADAKAPAKQAKHKKEEPIVSRRIVQVFIADVDENVPLDDAMLYRGNQHLTDATDQELFFEIDIQSILKTHNEKRVKIVNKKVKERTEYLEPVKIRDLRMTVVNIASF